MAGPAKPAPGSGTGSGLKGRLRGGGHALSAGAPASFVTRTARLARHKAKLPARRWCVSGIAGFAPPAGRGCSSAWDGAEAGPASAANTTVSPRLGGGGAGEPVLEDASVRDASSALAQQRSPNCAALDGARDTRCRVAIPRRLGGRPHPRQRADTGLPDRACSRRRFPRLESGFAAGRALVPKHLEVS